MPHIHSNSSRPATAALVLVLASLALAACGGSSSTSSSTTATTNASATTPTTGGAPGARGGRFTALRECLQKNGIALPARKPGQGPGAGGFVGGGGPTLPKGVTKAQYQAALKKCGGSLFRNGFKGGPRGFAGGFNTAAGKAALAKFSACMGERGIKIPAPNTSGKGPIFDTKGIDTTSAEFREAEAKCRSDLLGAFRARPGA